MWGRNRISATNLCGVLRLKTFAAGAARARQPIGSHFTLVEPSRNKIVV